jgi:hypothetical protein
LLTGIPSDNSCGLGKFTEQPSSGTSSIAFSAVNFSCVSNYSVHHEIGHNMGLRHDRYVDSSPGLGYNFGYTNNTVGCKIRSVMAYNNACTGSGCIRINYFSTGAFKIKKGAKQCAIGVKKGQSKAADNSQRLRETKQTVSTYQ